MPDEKMQELAEKMREAENKGLTEEEIKARDEEREKRRLENIGFLRIHLIFSKMDAIKRAALR